MADAHRLIAVDKSGTAAPMLYCPREPLGREELDLIDVPGNSLLLDRMLPAEPVAQGESWKISDQALAELLGLEAVSWTDVESMLGEITEGVAIISAGGSLSGAVGGVSTDIEMKAKYKFDLARRRITYFALLIKEKRAVGHIGPGLDTVAKLIMVINPLASSRHLSPELVEKFGAEKAGSRPALRYTAVSGQFRLDYDRRWYLTAEDPKLAIMRLLDRGELVAQCNVSALPSASKAPPTLAEFQHDIEQSLGKNFGQFVQASQDTTKSGYSVLRVVARGVVAQIAHRMDLLPGQRQAGPSGVAGLHLRARTRRANCACRPAVDQPANDRRAPVADQGRTAGRKAHGCPAAQNERPAVVGSPEGWLRRLGSMEGGEILAQQSGGDFQLHDFVRAFIDPAYADVLQVSPDAIQLGPAAAAKNLHRAVGGVPSRVRGEKLCLGHAHVGLGIQPFVAQCCVAGRLGCRGPFDQGVAGRAVHLDFRDMLLNKLVPADRLAVLVRVLA